MLVVAVSQPFNALLRPHKMTGEEEEKESGKVKAATTTIPLDPHGKSSIPLSTNDEEPVRTDTTNDKAAEILFWRSATKNYSGWDNLRWMAYSGTKRCPDCSGRSQVEDM
jgi:hypothetical protein